jgi:hypothetical protein
MNKKVIIICKMFWPFRFGNCTKNRAGNLACEYRLSNRQLVSFILIMSIRRFKSTSSAVLTEKFNFFSKIKCFNLLDMEYILNVNWVNSMSFLFWLFFLNVKHCLSFFFCIVCLLMSDLWLSFWYLQTFLVSVSHLGCFYLHSKVRGYCWFCYHHCSNQELGGPINWFNPTTFLCLSHAKTWICHGLFCVQWVKMRGDSSFCWYCWNC